MDVDAVVTWVDGGDASWRGAFDRWSERCRSDVGPDGRDPSRYRDNGELRYSLRAIRQYAPWFRRIHVVTAGQTPGWFEPHGWVRLVDHVDIFGPASLPTFNSHAIEARLHHIPGLAERFVYFNDDVFLARPQGRADYFTADGRPIVALDQTPLPDAHSSSGACVDLGALVARDLLLSTDLTGVPNQRPSHGPFALCRSVLLELERRFAPALAATASHRFRSASDVPLATFLAPLYAMASGGAVAGELRVGYAGLDDDDLAEQLARFDREEFDAFCLNDTERVTMPSFATVLAFDFLARRYPIRAPWERRAE